MSGLPSSRRARLLQVLLLAAVFFPVLREWSAFGARVSRLSYVLLVPLLAGILAFLAARRGKETDGAAPERPDDAPRASGVRLGPWVLLAAAGLLAVGSFSGIFTLSILGFPVAVTGLALSWGGVALMRRQAWSLCLLALMVPVPLPLLNRVNPELVEASGRTAVALLRPLDGGAEWFGSTLTYKHWTLIVAEACSGSGTFLTLEVLAVFLAGLFGLRPLAAFVTVLLAAPLSLFVNGLRIATSALCLDLWGPAAASGLPHELLGQVLVLATAGLLVAIAARVGGPGRPTPGTGVASS